MTASKSLTLSRRTIEQTLYKLKALLRKAAKTQPARLGERRGRIPPHDGPDRARRAAIQRLGL